MDKGHVRAPSLAELHNAIYYTGEIAKHLLEEGNVSVTLATTDFASADPGRLSELVRRTLALGNAELGPIPPVHLLVVYDRDGERAGGVVGRGISLLYDKPPDDKASSSMGVVVVHELMHLWNRADAEWLSEGFTRYLELWMSLHLDRASKREAAARLLSIHDNYARAIGKSTIAGARDSLAYSGGAVLAFCIDADLRADKRALFVVQQNAREKSGVPLSAEGFLAEVDAVSEKSGRAARERLAHKGPIDFGACLRQAGYTVRVSEYAGITGEALALDVLHIRGHDTSSAKVLRAEAGSPLQEGDVIESVEDSAISSMEDIPYLLRSHRRVGWSQRFPMAAPPVSRIGRYEIVGLLATGGMAEILLGRLVGPSGFERPVVVKRILPHLARLSAFVDMFVDEARIVAGIRHPNVVAVQELAHEGDELFLVMEYLEGESLGGVARRLVTRGENIDRALAAFIIAEACAGLHAAHELKDDEGLPRDLVHRDVSPQNVFVTYAGQVKVLDFGIAKAANRSTHTEAGQVKGKFAYMSPEQCLGKPLDRRSDIFALGIVLWEISTGRRLFKRGSEHLTFKAICDDRILLPSDIAPDYPPALEKVVMKALARRRQDRYQTAQEMRRDLLTTARALGASELPEDELSKLMQQVFAERIEEKEDMLRRFRGGTAPTHIPVAEADEDVDLPSVVEDLSTIHTSADVGAPPSGTARRWIAPSVAAALVAVVAAVFVGQRMGGLVAAASAPAAVSAEPAPTPAPPAASSAAPASRVVLRIETTPPGAKVVVAGKPEGETPVDVSVDKSGEPLSVTLSRAGYSPRTERVVPNMSQRLVLPLAPLPRSAPTKPREIPKFR